MTNREFFLQRRQMEAPILESVFRAVPDSQLDWKPEPKARTARELLGHLIGHEQDLIELAERGEINHRMTVGFKTVDEAVDLFKKACGEVDAKVQKLSDADWDSQIGKFLVSGTTVLEAPRRDLGWMLLFDSVHHRGQLSTYLRPMGSRVPAMYGPSADSAVAV
jgi:uncharacterized damage-inducible protein DinB